MMRSYGCVHEPPTTRREQNLLLVEVLEGPQHRICAIKEGTRKVEAQWLVRGGGNSVKDYHAAELCPSC